MSCANSYDGVLEAVMAGRPLSEIEAIVETLSLEDRQELLCTLCSIQHEIASNCAQHGDDVSALLSLNCALYVDGVATCPTDQPVAEGSDIPNRR
jgi:uncharacterized membrane protein